MGDLLFDITKNREKAWKLVISIKADVKSIEDTTNSAVEMINGYLDMRRGPVDSRGKTINEFLAQVGQAFEDLEHNAEEQYMQLSAMVNTTVIDDLWREVLGLDLGSIIRGLEKLPFKTACALVATTDVTSIARQVTGYIKETKWQSFSVAGAYTTPVGQHGGWTRVLF